MIHINCIAQNELQRLNVNNGLESNLVYKIVVDKYGYLWIATSKGVYRYNGYTLTNYDLSTGLANENVWDLYQDKQNRIWMISISDQLAYIIGNTSYTTRQFKQTVYPRSIVDVNGDVAFISRYTVGSGNFLCTEKNGEFSFYDLFNYKGLLFTTNDNVIMRYYRDSVFKVKYTLNNGKPTAFSEVFWLKLDSSYRRITGAKNQFLSGTYQLFQGNSSNTLLAVDTKTPEYRLVNLPVSNLYYAFSARGAVNCISDSFIYQLDNSLHIVNIQPLREILPDETIDGSKCSFFVDDALWGKCLATYTSGLYLGTTERRGTIGRFKYDLSGYVLAGCVNDDSYWWNKKQRKLTTIKNGVVSQLQIPSLSDLTCVVPYNQDSLLLLNADRISWYHIPRNSQSGFYSGLQITNNRIGLDTSRAAGGFKGIFTDSRNLYVVSKVTGLSNYHYYDHVLDINNLASDRFNGLHYDSLRKGLWVYKRNYLAPSLMWKTCRRSAAHGLAMINTPQTRRNSASDLHHHLDSCLHATMYLTNIYSLMTSKSR